MFHRTPFDFEGKKYIRISTESDLCDGCCAATNSRLCAYANRAGEQACGECDSGWRIEEATSERKIVDVLVCGECSYGILDEKTPEQVISKMLSVREKYVERDVYFAARHYGYDGGVELELRERREENDEEYSARLKEEQKEKDAKAKSKKSKEDNEFAEYVRLSKKYGKIDRIQK